MRFFYYPLLVAAFPSLVTAQTGTISTYAGAFPEGVGGPVSQLAIRGGPGHMVQDAAGNTYVAAFGIIYKLSSDGIATIAAGTGVRDSTGDNGPAVSARVNVGFNSGIIFDRQGNLVFSEPAGNRIRLISPDGTIRTIAGTGTGGFSGDGGLATAAQLSAPQGLALDSQGTLYFSDTNNHRIRRITAGGIISTFAGSSISGLTGDGGPASNAEFVLPGDLVMDSAGNLYIADVSNRGVRRITTDGVIKTVAGFGQPDANLTDAHGNTIDWTSLSALAMDRSDNLYIATSNHILKRSPGGTLSILAGSGSLELGEYRGPAIEAPIDTGTPMGMYADAAGNLLVSLNVAGRIAKIDSAGNFSIVAGTSVWAGAAGAATYARLTIPSALAFDSAGSLYVREQTSTGIRKVSPAGLITIRDGLYSDGSIAIDRQGNIFVSDFATDTIQRIDSAGNVTRYAGTPTSFGVVPGFSGDGGPALQAHFNNPSQLAFDGAGALYVLDSGNRRVRKITSDGIVTTVAGSGVAGPGGDGGPATSAELSNPSGMTIDRAGNLFIADVGTNRIRKITPQGIISTYAGTGLGFASTGDGGPAIQANLSNPYQMTVDSTGVIYFMEGFKRVRKITTSGIIFTVAGNESQGFSGDGGPARNASFNNIKGLAVDANGDIFIADQDNNRIRRVQGSAPFSVSRTGLVFALTLGGAPLSQTLTVSSPDGVSRTFNAIFSAPWLKVSPSSGPVSLNQTAQLTVTADAKGLPKGIYSTDLTLQDTGSVASVTIPVTLTVSGTAQQLRLSQVGLTFAALQGGSAPPAQSIQVLNSGTGTLAWSAAAATLAGNATWLRIAPASGSSTAGATASPMTVSADPAGLAAGSYYGQITVTSREADNSPQNAIVLLNVLPSNGTPGPQVDPTGLIYTAAPGTAPAAQDIKIANITNHAITYTATVALTNGTGWLTAPAAGSVPAGQVQTLSLQAKSQALAAGVYRATLTLRFAPDNTTIAVQIAVVVNDAVGLPAAGKTPIAGNSCTPKQLVPVIRRPGAGYQTEAGWPLPIEASIVDDCGAPLSQGTVGATFSTNDPQVSLTSTGGGVWQGSWASRSAQANLTITLRAQNAEQTLSGQMQVSIKSNPSTNPQPEIAPGGVLNAASFQGESPPAVGEYVSVFGSRLAGAFTAAPRLPLPASLSDTVVAVGGSVAPLHFASDGQINAILPYRIADNTTHQIIVRRGNTLSVPRDLLVGSTQPAIFTTSGAGTGQGHIYAATPEGLALADNSHPALPGDVIVIYATGLGAVEPPLEAGVAAPSDPLSMVVSLIGATIQGKKASVLFAGLAPGFAGVYQVNVQIPADVTPDSAAPLILTAGQQQSLVVTLAISRPN